MRKMTLFALLLTFSLALTGCGALVEMPEISDEEEELITEYAAGLIIKYDTKFVGTNLLDDEALAFLDAKEKEAREKERAYKKAAEEYLAKKQVAMQADNKEEASADEENNEEASAKTSKEPTVDNVASFYGLDGFSVNYTGYQLVSTYSDSVMMEVDSSAGKQLLVLDFDVVNTGSAENNFDMFYKNPGFAVSVDGGSNIKSLGTLLFDDMSSYVGAIEAGGSRHMVLLFEVDDSISSIGSLDMTVRSGMDRGTLRLQ